MSLESSASVPAAAPPPGVILFGRDERQRPHASYFADNEIVLAERAAALMGMQVLSVCDAKHRSLADELPRGRIFEASGKAFVPFVKQGVFDRLFAAAGRPDAPMPIRTAAKPAGSPPEPKSDQQGSGDAPGGAGGAHKPPFDWADIGIGSLVLATSGGPQEGWFEAVVVYTKADDHFELRWRDFPLDANITSSSRSCEGSSLRRSHITRHRHELALLHPATPTKGGQV
jgi:hypothetical protein